MVIRGVTGRSFFTEGLSRRFRVLLASQFEVLRVFTGLYFLELRGLPLCSLIPKWYGRLSNDVCEIFPILFAAFNAAN